MQRLLMNGFQGQRVPFRHSLRHLELSIPLLSEIGLHGIEGTGSVGFFFTFFLASEWQDLILPQPSSGRRWPAAFGRGSLNP